MFAPHDDDVILAERLFVGDRDGHWKKRHVAITEKGLHVCDTMVPLLLLLLLNPLPPVPSLPL
jgi:hypothetical protein